MILHLLQLIEDKLRDRRIEAHYQALKAAHIAGDKNAMRLHCEAMAREKGLYSPEKLAALKAIDDALLEAIRNPEGRHHA